MRLTDIPAAARPAEADGQFTLDDYGVIGNCKSIALVSRTGSIDWWCLPHFSAPSIFAALLDRRRGGRFAIDPARVLRSEQRYLEDSCVLETNFQCEGGSVRILDFMTVLSELENRRNLQAQQELVRIVECRAGKVDVAALYQPRPDYARHTPGLVERGRLGWLCTCGGMAGYLSSDVQLRVTEPGTLRGDFSLRAGERREFVFGYCENEIAVLRPLGDETRRRMNCTIEWWRRWSEACRYRGPHRATVLRSCLTLKLLSYCLSGAVVAAATTSLPEDAEAGRNWDYRYCWLRDTSMVLQSFIDLGFREEARAFLAWLLHATRLTRPRLQVLYDVYGETSLKERELAHLAGFDGCGPVLVGNDAHLQFQLDIYGEVILTAYDFVARGGRLDLPERRLVAGFGESVTELWRFPDKGIWEIRGGPRHNTYSKLMCWVGLDRLLQLDRLQPLGIDRHAYAVARDAIREDIDRHAYRHDINAYVGYYGGRAPDASLLLMARYNYLDARDPRMLGTCALIERELTVRSTQGKPAGGADSGLLYRYPPGGQYDGVAGPENLFGICSFWLVDYLARRGDVERAQDLFDRLLALANPLGLYAEEFSRKDLRPMGNFPQAFTHVGLITAAISLEQARAGLRDEEIAR